MSLFDRLRAWFGSFFGDGASAAPHGTDDPESDSEGPAPRVVHRDDRPLETPSTMDGTEPPASVSTSGAESETHTTIPDAEAGAESDTGGRKGAGVDSDPVSIPDAEATAADRTDDATPGGDETAREATAAERTDATPAPERGDGSEDESADTAFACSVCGTTVDDPTEPCPLCRSTDVVPTAGGAGDAEAPTRDGRTAVSAADDDDEAVDRLRDVRDDG